MSRPSELAEKLQEMADAAHMTAVLERFIETCSTILPRDRLPAPTGDLRSDAFALIVAIHKLSGELIDQFGGADWWKGKSQMVS